MTQQPPAVGHLTMRGDNWHTMREIRAVQDDGGVLWTWPGGCQPIRATADEWQAWLCEPGVREVSAALNAGVATVMPQ